MTHHNHTKTISLVNLISALSFVLLCASCDQPVVEKPSAKQSEVNPISLHADEPYKKLEAQIDDYWFEQNGASIKQISYLTDFDNTKLDHWRALLEFGYKNAYPASQLGKSRLIFFTNSAIIEKQTSFDTLTDHNRGIVIGMYQILPNGSPLFTPNPFGMIDETYFSTLEENREFLNEHHLNALQ